MLTQYNLKMPHAVYGGENAMDNITAIIKARGAKKVAMFTDKGIEGAGLFALPEEAVKASGAEYYVLDELPPNPATWLSRSWWMSSRLPAPTSSWYAAAAPSWTQPSWQACW